MFAFAFEGAANRGERLRQRKNVARDEHISILCSDWMPVNTLSGNGNLRHEIGSAKGNTFICRTAQSDPAYDSIFCSNLLFIKKLTELLSLGIGRDSRRQPHSEA